MPGRHPWPWQRLASRSASRSVALALLTSTLGLVVLLLLAGMGPGWALAEPTSSAPDGVVPAEPLPANAARQLRVAAQPLRIIKQQIAYQHGVSFIEPLKYDAQFEHFEYTSPQALSGGTVRFPELGTFDSFNNILDKGRVALGLGFGDSRNLLYDRLLEPAIDESASYYGRLAEGVWIAPDYSAFAFKIRAGARWHDGKPLTVKDVLFSFQTFLEHGSAGIRTALLELDDVQIIGEREILFRTKPEVEPNILLPFAVGGFPILPAHYWAERDITKTTVEPPLGSGPFRIGDFVLGRYINFERVEDYWGRNIPVNVGRYNYGTVKFDYFRDESIMVEALKGDVLDVRHETVSKQWATEYVFPAVEAGYFKRELTYISRPWGMWWPIIWNLDDERFDDIRVREALWLLHDFEWVNRVILFGFYHHADSFFFNSPMASSGLPSTAELALLEPWRGHPGMPDRVFTHEWQSQGASGFGLNRDNLKKALALFEAAGWEVRDGVMVNAETGAPFDVDFIFVSPMLLRSAMPFVNALNRVGIRTESRSPEVSNWLYRMRSGKFTGGSQLFIPSNTPGLALRNHFSSTAADQEYSQNWTRVRNPVVDALIDHVLAATTAEEFYAATRALDRVLLWNFYWIPTMAQPGFRLVYWDKFDKPENPPALLREAWLDTWWIDPAKVERVRAGMAQLTGSSR